jgi:HK97 family phage prohead protease
MENRVADVREYIEAHDPKLYREAPLLVAEIRDSKNQIPGSYSIKGLASVYDKWSLDLGGFRERIMPGAFDRVLGEDPHVLHTWDHDTSKTLSSTRSRTFPLELKSIPKEGLGFYSRVAPTSYSADLRILMEGDVVTQSSFAFTVKDAEWRFLEDEDMVERDIKEVDGLFDVTTCALGAYPQTESEIAVRSLMRGAKRTGVVIPAAITSGAASSTTSLTVTGFGTRGSGAEGNAESPAGEPAPETPEAPPAADPAAQDDPGAGTPPATPPDNPQVETPAEREAREREFEGWRQQRLAEHRRTREFAFGVNHKQEEAK